MSLDARNTVVFLIALALAFAVVGYAINQNGGFDLAKEVLAQHNSAPPTEIIEMPEQKPK